MCVDDAYVKKLAADAFEWQKLGQKLPGSAGVDKLGISRVHFGSLFTMTQITTKRLRIILFSITTRFKSLKICSCIYHKLLKISFTVTLL